MIPAAGAVGAFFEESRAKRGTTSGAGRLRPEPSLHSRPKPTQAPAAGPPQPSSPLAPLATRVPAGSLRTKHLRADIQPEDGTRIYVSRRWPRGIAKGERFSEWMKALAPSTELLDAYLHEGLDWEAYEERFLEEMRSDEARARIEELADRIADGETITLLCDHPRDAPDDECHRFLVEELVEAELG